MQIVSCDPARHAAAILAIFNEVIANSTALYEYQPRTAQTLQTWFATKAAGNFPVLCAEDDAGQLLGFASYGTFRHFPAYQYTVEHSVYVDARFRGQGVGRKLLAAIIDLARQQDYHVMIGAIDAANASSIALHEGLGFTHCGTVREAGFKFGRWLDVAFYQRILETPSAPRDA